MVQDADAWDDTALVKAYDSAVKSYHEQEEIIEENDNEYSLAQGQLSQNPVQEASSESCEQAHNGLCQNSAEAVLEKFRKQSRSAAHRNEQLDSKQHANVAEDGLPSKRVPISFQEEYRDSILIPPPPPPPYFERGMQSGTHDEELEALLISWYEAGYRAGRYAALRMK